MPILRDIIFDIPYIPSKEVLDKLTGRPEEECNKITVEDYEKNYKERNFRFRLQTGCITNMYVHYLGKFRNDKCRRIIIECVPSIEKEPRAFEVFYIVQVKFDIDKFFELNDIDKKRKALELIKITVSQIVEVEGWDKSIFEHAYNKVILENYIYSVIWKKQKNSPNRQYTAKVLLEHDLYSSDISILITDKNGRIVKREKIVTESPAVWAYSKYFGDLRWLTDKEVALISKFEGHEYKVKLD